MVELLPETELGHRSYSCAAQRRITTRKHGNYFLQITSLSVDCPAVRQVYLVRDYFVISKLFSLGDQHGRVLRWLLLCCYSTIAMHRAKR